MKQYISTSASAENLSEMTLDTVTEKNRLLPSSFPDIVTSAKDSSQSQQRHNSHNTARKSI